MAMAGHSMPDDQHLKATSNTDMECMQLQNLHTSPVESFA